MPSCTASVTVQAPPERVFAVCTDLARAPDRIEAITRIDVLTEGAVGVGTRFRETRVMFGREASEEMEIVEFDPPRSFVMTAESHGMRYRTAHRFVPEGGGTRVEIEFSGRAVSLGAKLLLPLGALMMGACRKALSKDLADVKRAVESGS